MESGPLFAEWALAALRNQADSVRVEKENQTPEQPIWFVFFRSANEKPSVMPVVGGVTDNRYQQSPGQT